VEFPLNTPKAVRVDAIIKHLLHHAIKTIIFHNAAAPIFQSLTIQTSNDTEAILPTIFKSMRYDCYLHIHFSFDKGIFSTIPLEKCKNQLTNTLYRRGLFFVIITKKPKDLFSEDELYTSYAKEHNVFVLRIKKKEINQLAKMYFFCAFCGIPLVRVPPNSESFKLNMKTVMTLWRDASHDWVTDSKLTVSKQQKCSSLDILRAYEYDFDCDTRQFENQLLRDFTKLNFSLRMVEYDETGFPAIEVYFNIHGVQRFIFSTPFFLQYRVPRIVYCINADFKFTVNGRMWIQNISPHVWVLILTLLFATAIVRTVSTAYKNKSKSTWSCFASSVRLVLRFVVRQISCHNCLLLGLLELFFGLLLSAYENSVTVQVLVPASHKPFESTHDLYLNNYTFVIADTLYGPEEWIKAQYNSE